MAHSEKIKIPGLVATKEHTNLISTAPRLPSLPLNPAEPAVKSDDGCNCGRVLLFREAPEQPGVVHSQGFSARP
jgi:hypothetical protein